MKTQSALQRNLQTLFITGVSIFAFTKTHAEDPTQVTAGNFVHAEPVNATLEVDIRRRFTCSLPYIKMFRPGIRPL